MYTFTFDFVHLNQFIGFFSAFIKEMKVDAELESIQ